MNKHYDNFKDLSLTTKIKAVRDDNWYEFEDTVFYGEKGGMLRDLGTINGHEVIDLKWEGNKLLHKVNASLTNPINMEVNAKERYINTSVQTALHILDGYYRRLGLELPAVGVNHDNQWFEINSKDITDDDLAKVQIFMDNAIIQEVPVTFSYMKGSDYPDPNYAKFDELRIVKIGELDEQPCGTPHVNHTGQILNFTILDSEKTSRGTKVYFTCNFLSDIEEKHDYKLVKEAAKSISVPKNELLDKINDLVIANKDFKKEINELYKELAAYKAQDILSDSETIIKSDINNANLFRTLGQSLINKVNRNLLVYALIDGKINFIIVSNDNKARDIYNQNREALNAQGGGSPKMVNAKTDLDEEMFLKTFVF